MKLWQNFRNWLYQRFGIRWHSQNLDSRPGDKGESTGKKWRHGRGWLYIPRKSEWCEKERGYNSRRCIGAEWVWFSKWCHIGFDVACGEYDLSFKIGTPLLAVWVHCEGFLSPEWVYKFQKKQWCYGGLTWELSIHGGALWWSFGHTEMGWDSKTPRWKHGCFHFDDFFLGRTKFTSEKLESVRVVVPMPEGNYPATVTMERCTWKRPRWFKREALTAEIVPDKPIPVPGKGENSWDCDDDAIFSLHCGVRNPEQAVAKIVESALRDRARYGGRDWQPVSPPL